MSEWEGIVAENIKKGSKGIAINGLGEKFTVTAEEDLRKWHNIAIRKEGEEFFAIEIIPSGIRRR